MRKMLLCAVFIVPALTAAAHHGEATGGVPGGMGGHLAGLLTGTLLFLITESGILYFTFSTWFKDPDYPVPPSPERFFQAAVFSFVAMVVTGGILTYFFSGIDWAHTPMVAAYGYNNVCVVFDNPPSTYICPVYWFFVAYLIGRYAVEDTKRLMRLTSIGRGLKAVFYGLNVLLVMSAAFFFVTLAIHPEVDIYGHSIPFVFLIFTLPSVALVHWWQLEERSTLHTAGVALYVALSLVKLTFDIYALSTGHYVPPGIAQSVDVLWMVCALSAPFVMPAPVLKERLPNATAASAATRLGAI